VNNSYIAPTLKQGGFADGYFKLSIGNCHTGFFGPGVLPNGPSPPQAINKVLK
jgi:hypothetical protein